MVKRPSRTGGFRSGSVSGTSSLCNQFARVPLNRSGPRQSIYQADDLLVTRALRPYAGGRRQRSRALMQAFRAFAPLSHMLKAGQFDFQLFEAAEKREGLTAGMI